MKTLGDLLERFQLYAVCTPCERMERVPIRELAEQLGHDLTIDQARRRLRCRGCGTRTGDIRIVYVGENARLAGFHYRGSPAPRPATDPLPAGNPPADAQPFSSSVDSRVRPKPSTPT